MKKCLFFSAALFGLALSGWATFVYPRVCVCSLRRLNLYCYKCGHFAYQCPRFRDSFSCPCLIEGGR